MEDGETFGSVENCFISPNVGYFDIIGSSVREGFFDQQLDRHLEIDPCADKPSGCGPARHDLVHGEIFVVFSGGSGKAGGLGFVGHELIRGVRHGCFVFVGDKETRLDRRNHRAGVAEPFGKGFWLTAMLLSTLIPTLLRGTIAIAGALTLFMPVAAHRRHVDEDLQAWDHQDEKAQELALQRAKRLSPMGGQVSGSSQRWC